MDNFRKVVISNNRNRTETVEYHFHLHYEILYVKSGIFTLCFDGKSTDVLPGELCIIPPFLPHKTIYQNAFTDSIIFDTDYISHYLSREVIESIDGFNQKILFIPKSDDADSAKHLFERITNLGGDRAYIQILMMLKKATPDKSRIFSYTNKSLYNVIACINTNYLTKLSLDDIAKKCHITRFYICRLMKKFMAITPVDYITFLKIKQAVLLLKETNNTVKKISENLCFSSPKYFANVFKNYFGVSPSVFRKSMYKMFEKKFFLKR